MKVIEDRTQIFANRNIMTQGIELFVIKENRDGRSFCTFEITVEPIPEGTFSTTPSGFLTYDEADQLMTELWNAGARPRKGEGTVSHVEGLKEHLKDLRKITFSTLGIK